MRINGSSYLPRINRPTKIVIPKLITHNDAYVFNARVQKDRLQNMCDKITGHINKLGDLGISLVLQSSLSAQKLLFVTSAIDEISDTLLLPLKQISIGKSQKGIHLDNESLFISIPTDNKEPFIASDKFFKKIELLILNNPHYKSAIFKQLVETISTNKDIPITLEAFGDLYDYFIEPNKLLKSSGKDFTIPHKELFKLDSVISNINDNKKSFEDGFVFFANDIRPFIDKHTINIRRLNCTKTARIFKSNMNISRYGINEDQKSGIRINTHLGMLNKMGIKVTLQSYISTKDLEFIITLIRNATLDYLLPIKEIILHNDAKDINLNGSSLFISTKSIPLFTSESFAEKIKYLQKPQLNNNFAALNTQIGHMSFDHIISNLRNLDDHTMLAKTLEYIEYSSIFEEDNIISFVPNPTFINNNNLVVLYDALDKLNNKKDLPTEIINSLNGIFPAIKTAADDYKKTPPKITLTRPAKQRPPVILDFSHLSSKKILDYLSDKDIRVINQTIDFFYENYMIEKQNKLAFNNKLNFGTHQLKNLFNCLMEVVIKGQPSPTLTKTIAILNSMDSMMTIHLEEIFCNKKAEKQHFKKFDLSYLAIAQKIPAFFLENMRVLENILQNNADKAKTKHFIKALDHIYSKDKGIFLDVYASLSDVAKEEMQSNANKYKWKNECLTLKKWLEVYNKSIIDLSIKLSKICQPIIAELEAGFNKPHTDSEVLSILTELTYPRLHFQAVDEKWIDIDKLNLTKIINNSHSAFDILLNTSSISEKVGLFEVLFNYQNPAIVNQQMPHTIFYLFGILSFPEKFISPATTPILRNVLRNYILGPGRIAPLVEKHLSTFVTKAQLLEILSLKSELHALTLYKFNHILPLCSTKLLLEVLTEPNVLGSKNRTIMLKDMEQTFDNTRKEQNAKSRLTEYRYYRLDTIKDFLQYLKEGFATKKELAEENLAETTIAKKATELINNAYKDPKYERIKLSLTGQLLASALNDDFS